MEVESYHGNNVEQKTALIFELVSFTFCSIFTWYTELNNLYAAADINKTNHE
jgi:hypothetical protein